MSEKKRTPAKTTSATDLSRRKILQGAGVASTATALGIPLILVPPRAQAATELNMIAWYGHGEPDMVEEFEAKHNVKIKAKYYAGGDNMLALISQSPPGTYDIILSDAEFVQLLNEAGYIEKMDPNEYNMHDLYDEFTHFPGHWNGGDLYSVIVRFGFLGVSFNTDIVSHEEAMDYNVLWEPKLTGKVGHFDWHLPNLGCLSLRDGNNNPSPFDIDDAQWKKLQETTLSLKPQVGGYFDYGGTFSSLRSGEIHAMCGIGDWITGVVRKDGSPVDSVVPKQGGIQWTESYSIGKGSKKQDLVKDFIRYMTSGPGQVRSAGMEAYPAMSPYKAGWKSLNEANPAEAKRQRMVFDGPNCLDDIRDGRIHFRGVPVQQSLEEWNEFWSEYKNA
jgi:spermidine/putrescine transport system substrate-binding protein